MDRRPLLYTLKEFRELTRMSETAFWQLRKDGKGPKLTRINRKDYVRPESAEKWAIERERDTNRKAGR